MAIAIRVTDVASKASIAQVTSASSQYGGNGNSRTKYLLNMSITTSFKEMGFLSDTVRDSTDAFAITFSPWVDLYYDLNKFAQEQFHITKLQNDDLRGLLI